MISDQKLGDAIGLNDLDDDDILGILSDSFSSARWESGLQVAYLGVDGMPALTLVYNKRGQIVGCKRGAGLTGEILGKLRRGYEIASTDEGSEVFRDVLFSTPELKGCWRYADDWQITPAPEQAPRPEFLLADHPFILEYRVRKSSNFAISHTRRWKRLWELHLLLSMALVRPIKREWPSHPHHWVVLPHADGETPKVAYLNEGYMVGGGFVFHLAELSDASPHPKLIPIDDDRYYSRKPHVGDQLVNIPACLNEIFRRFESAERDTRDRILRACYWLDASRRAWDTSKAQSFISAITAVETLVPSAPREICPTCDKDRSPGLTARFRAFVENYASKEDLADRAALYDVRSSLVHGGQLHNLDMPTPWGSLLPNGIMQTNLHDRAFAVSRTVVRNWFLDRGNHVAHH